MPLLGIRERDIGHTHGTDGNDHDSVLFLLVVESYPPVAPHEMNGNTDVDKTLLETTTAASNWRKLNRTDETSRGICLLLSAPRVQFVPQSATSMVPYPRFPRWGRWLFDGLGATPKIRTSVG